MHLLGRIFAAAAMVITLTAPGAAADSWWDGGYDDTWDEPLPPPEAGPLYGCENSTLPDTDLVLHKTTSPPPDTPVHPGDEIFVEITWHVYDWTGPDLHKAIDCVYIDGLLAPGLSGGERPTPNDGHFAWHYVVPLDVPPGATICDQGFVSGPHGWDDYSRAVSNVVCFPVVVPPPPPPPSECCAPPPPPECCAPPPPSECCVPPPAETPATTTTTTTTTSTTTTSTTTTTTTMPAPEDDAEPYVESVRLEQQAPPTEVLPAQEDVLPRTGGSGSPARMAAAALALAALAGRARGRRGR